MHLPGMKVKVLSIQSFLTLEDKNNMLNISYNFFVQFFVIFFVHQEIEEMISTVDKNQDGKISYSEFRVAD